MRKNVTNYSFNERIAELRNNRHWNKSYVAECVGVAPNTYANWEYGNRQPGFDSLVKIADLHNVSVDYLLGRVNQKANENLTTGEFQFLRELETGVSFDVLVNKFNLLLDGSPVPTETIHRILAYIRAERSMALTSLASNQ